MDKIRLRISKLQQKTAEAIDANGVVGEGIVANYISGSDWTEFTSVPESAILGLLAILGLTFLRKK